MTISKSTLLGILLLGMLLGGGTAVLVMKSDPTRRSDGGAAAKGAREKKGSVKKGSGAEASSMSPREASSELARWVGSAGTEDGFRQVKLLLSRATEWSPETTMEQVMQIEDPYRRRDAMGRLFRSWITRDQDGALAAIGALGNVALRRDLFREALKGLSDHDPVAAIKLLKASGNLRDQELWARSFANWERTDREGAVKGILEIEHPGLRNSILKSVGQRMAERDLGKAIEWTQTLSGAHAEVALAGVLSQAAGTHPQAVVAQLDKITDGRSRREILGRAAAEWAERDPDGAITWAADLVGRERELAIGEIAGQVLEIDPDRAEEIVGMIPESQQRRDVLQQIARLRATVDVEEAMDWISGLPAEDQVAAWQGTAREWARVDPRGAAEHAAAIEDPVAFRELVSAVSYSWAQSDPAEAAEWARTLDGPLDGRVQEGAMNRIVETWSRDDPAAAGEFVVGSLDGELQASMTRQVVGRWMRSDMEEAGAWVDSLADGRARDGAVYTLVQSIEREYPEVALQWANTIGDERRREDTERRILKRLGRGN